MNCSRRQQVHTPDGIQLRCINRDCPAWGRDVTEELCNHCPHRVTKKETCREARKTSMATPEELQHRKEKQKGMEIDEEVIERTPDGAPPPPPFTPEYPNWSVQAWLYKEALIRWKKAGYPTRDQDEVDRIHKEHCLGCDWYDKDKKRCKGCGCRVTDGAVAVVNKIKMATEHCPKELW